MPRTPVLFAAALSALLALTPPALVRGAHAASTPHAALADVMKKQPYLIYPGNPSQMTVLWQLSATATSTIEWGTDANYSAGSVPSVEYGTDHQHTFTIPDLAPATHYLYRVTTDGFTYGGSFTSAPSPEADKLKFFAYGDTRTYPVYHDQVAAGMMSVYAADSAYQTLALFMGDFVATGNSETYWTNEFFTPQYTSIRALLANVPLQSAMGNHENLSPVLFTKYYPYPWVAGRYWSFDYGPIHVTMLDQYTTWTAGSPQMQWFANDLATSTKTWKFVVMHEPGWSSGNGHANLAAVQTLIQPLCQQYGVAVVFTGHNHNYCRAVVNGIMHVTTGGGGAPLEGPLAGQPNVVVSAQLHHYCTIAIDGGVLKLQAINSASGAIIDSFTLVRAVPDRVAPNVHVTAPAGGESWLAGSDQVIRWNASDNVGVDSLRVELSLHGAAGPWQVVASGLAGVDSLAWTLPATPSDSALVRVTAWDHALNTTVAPGDGLFRIVDPNAGVVPAGRMGLSLAHPRPNPAQGGTSLAFSLPERGHARLEILDLGGRRLWSTEGDFAAGPHASRWDGRTREGMRAGAGLYFVRLGTPWGTRSERLVWLK